MAGAAVDEACLAVRLYNDPAERRSFEAFIVHMHLAWLYLLHAELTRDSIDYRYRDPKNPPSLLLLQAVLLAGSRVCTNPQLMDANGSTTPAAMTFYKRAKALYDANYEDDRVTIVQALVLLGWYWEGPEGEF